MQRRSILTAAGAAAALHFLPRPTLAQGAQITGAGASFPQLVYDKWAKLAQAPLGVQVAYQAVGSSAGADQVIARQVDFGATDNPKRPGALREQKLIQFPTVLGAVVPYVNLPGVQPDQLRLSGALLADLFLGTVTRWNDPKLAAENPGVRLPDLAVTPVHRVGASGTTFIFSTYLTRVSEAWAAGPRASNQVKWPAGVGAEGNSGMAEKVRGTPGAISYADASFAREAKLATVSLKNHNHGFIAPDAASFAKAAAAGDWASTGLVADMIDIDAAGAWPIVSPTFILMPTNPLAEKVAAAKNTFRFFDWAFRNAGEATTQMGFVPLPAALHEAIHGMWSQVKGPDGQPVWGA